ncbi:MAG: Flp pilus assembly protein CpaB [Candidatus Eiseniibacteriota bacterium]|nr:MAG: Flp pilus assembly protein CpaB [Candidatus Eisenbacteria bacterium]
MTRIRVVVVLAVIFGLLASVAIYRYLAQYDRVIKEKQIATQPVVVASMELPFGTVLTNDNIEAANWPVEIVPAGAIASTGDLTGRVVRTPLSAGEPVLDAKLAPVGMDRGLPMRVPPGMRAMTVPVNVVSGVSGFVLPDTKVDVVVTIRPETKKESVAKLILQNLSVLAADQKLEDRDGKPMSVQSVTLLVTPTEAEKLALAANLGDIQLVLRSPADADSAGTNGTTIAQMLATSEPVQRAVPQRPVRRVRTVRTPPKPVEEPKREPTKVEVIRGTKRTEEKFEEKSEEKKK